MSNLRTFLTQLGWYDTIIDGRSPVTVGMYVLGIAFLLVLSLVLLSIKTKTPKSDEPVGLNDDDDDD